MAQHNCYLRLLSSPNEPQNTPELMLLEQVLIQKYEFLNLSPFLVFEFSGTAEQLEIGLGGGGGLGGGEGAPLVTLYLGSTIHLFVLTLYNSKNIEGARAPTPRPPCSAVPDFARQVQCTMQYRTTA